MSGKLVGSFIVAVALKDRVSALVGHLLPLANAQSRRDGEAQPMPTYLDTLQDD